MGTNQNTKRSQIFLALDLPYRYYYGHRGRSRHYLVEPPYNVPKRERCNGRAYASGQSEYLQTEDWSKCCYSVGRIPSDRRSGNDIEF